MSKIIGRVLREARRHMKLTQEQVARRMGVSRAAVGQWEAGDGPSTDNLVRVCDELGIELHAALNGVMAHKSGFAHEKRRPEVFPEVAVEREATQLEKYPFNQENYFIENRTIPFFPSSPSSLIGELYVPVSPLLFVPRDKYLPNNNNLYILALMKSYMVPEINDMTMVYVDAGSLPSIGQIILLRINNDFTPDQNITAGRLNKVQSGIVGILESFDSNEVVIRQMQPSRRATIATREVAGIHRIHVGSTLAQV